MNFGFAIANVLPGKLNALVKNIMRQTGVEDPNEAVRLINSGEWIIQKLTRAWREEDHVIYFTVTSDGTTGEDWIKRLQDNRFSVGYHAKKVLRSPDFKPTKSVTTEVAVFKGNMFGDSHRLTRNIRNEADGRKFSKPNAELACLIRMKFTDSEIQAMGLISIVAMHEPINQTEDGHGPIDPTLLYVYTDGEGNALESLGGEMEISFFRSYGFAFIVSEASLES
jgi:hypothetical protein